MKLLVLDLDETLVHATTTRLEREPDFAVGSYSVYKRPGLVEFLNSVAENYRVAVWTSSNELYAEAIVARVFPEGISLEFVWSRSRCTPRRNFSTDSYDWLKDLKKLKRKGYSLEEVLVVDDSPEKLVRSYGNLVPAHPYEGDLSDDELSWLSKYLGMLVPVQNVRRLEKRGWRKRINEA